MSTPTLRLPALVTSLACCFCAPWAATATAQVPTGWAVGAAFKQFGYTSGGGGLTVFHPHRDERWQVTGLPDDLTGLNVSGVQVHGAYSVLVRPSDQRLFVGELTLLANDTLEIHEIALQGRQATVLQRHVVGARDPNARGTVLAHMEWLQDGRILFSYAGASSPNLPGGTSGLGILDPSNGTVHSVPLTGIRPGPDEFSALAIDADRGVAYFAINRVSTAPRIADVYSVAVPSGGQAQLIGSWSDSIISELSFDNTDDLVACAQGPASGLYRLAAGTWTPVAPGINARGAFTLDPLTGDYLCRVDRNGAQTIQRIERDGTATQIQSWPVGSEVVLDMAILPSIDLYGTASGPSAYAFDLRPSPGGTPVLGNSNFSLDATASTGPLPGLAVFGLRPLDRTLGSLRLLVDPALPGIPLPTAHTVSIPLPIPDDPSLTGLNLYVQLVHQNGSALVGSRALRFTAY